jgi:hypothetical protein
VTKSELFIQILSVVNSCHVVTETGGIDSDLQKEIIVNFLSGPSQLKYKNMQWIRINGAVNDNLLYVEEHKKT